MMNNPTLHDIVTGNPNADKAVNAALKKSSDDMEHMSKLALLHYLKSQAKTEVVVTLGVKETKQVVPMSVIDEEIRKLEE